MSHRRSTSSTPGIVGAFLALGLLFAFAVPPTCGVALAQDGGESPVANPMPPTVAVTGRGTASAQPDMAAFVAGVEVVADDLAAAQAEATQRMTAVLDTLRAAGLPDEAIQTVGFRVEVVSEGEQPPPPEVAPEGVEPAVAVVATPGPPAIQGFRIVNEVRVEVADLDRLGALLDEVLAAGANTVFGIELTVEDPGLAQRQARTRAVEDARAAAEDLAAAAGLQLGDVVSIVADDASQPPQPMLAEAQVADSAVPIAPGQTEISVIVRVTYALVPAGAAPAATPLP